MPSISFKVAELSLPSVSSGISLAASSVGAAATSGDVAKDSNLVRFAADPSCVSFSRFENIRQILQLKEAQSPVACSGHGEAWPASYNISSTSKTR